MNNFNQRIANLSPAKRAILEQFLRKDTTVVNEQIVPRRRGASDPIALSFGQQRLWLLSQLSPDSPLYNLPKAVQLNGDLNTEALQQTFNTIVNRHEVLRTTFTSVDGSFVQITAPNQSIAVIMVDLDGLELRGLNEQLAVVKETTVQHLLNEAAQRPFNLSGDVMLRIILLRLDREDYVLLLIMHHIAFDGWSTGILFREMAIFYGAFSTGTSPLLPDLPIQYADFAEWQQQWLSREVLEIQLNYWQQQLGDNVPVLKLPIAELHSTVQTYRGARQCLVLHKNLTEALKMLSRHEKVTLFMTLLAVFKMLLYKYSGVEDINVCSPVAGRNRVETQGLIGYFGNIVVMRTDLSGNPSFRELLFRVRCVVLGAYTHQDLPFQTLADFPNLARTSLSRAMFSLENTSNLSLPGITSNFLSVNKGTADFDLSLFIVEKAKEFTAVFEYKTDLFNATTITQILEYFQTLLENIVANPEQRLFSLPLPYGQVAQNALSARESARHGLKKCYVAPRDALERKLKTVWEKVLDTKPISLDDNFFELGGDSLVAVRLLTETAAILGKKPPFAVLFQAPTIRQLASILRRDNRATA